MRPMAIANFFRDSGSTRAHQGNQLFLPDGLHLVAQVMDQVDEDVFLGVVVDVELAHGNAGLLAISRTVVPWKPLRVKSCRAARSILSLFFSKVP